MKKSYTLFCLILAVFYTFTVANVCALTPNERKLVLNIQAQLHQAQADYARAKTDLEKADTRASIAEASAQQTATALSALQGQIDALANTAARLTRQVAEMKPVYDQCKSHWGLGAIAYGVGELCKHLLIAIAVIAVVGVGLYIASFFFPVLAIGLHVAVGVVGKGLAAIGALLRRLLPKLKARVLES